MLWERTSGRSTRQTGLLPGCETCGEPPQAAEKVEAAVDVLAEYGPTPGRPLVDTLTGSKLANLKELRPRQTNIRILFVFDPWRSAILLVAGDKTGQWHRWYEVAIPQAEQLFALYLKERAAAEEEDRG